MSDGEINTTENHWQDKYNDLQTVVKNLSTYSSEVVKKYEELLKKFTNNEVQYKKLKERFREKGEQIKQAREVLAPISDELISLREKYRIAVDCQIQAEQYASRINSKNKELKRQSKMVLDLAQNINIVDINLDEEEEKADENEYLETLRQKTDDLEEQKSALIVEVNELRDSYQAESEHSAYLKTKIQIYQEELKQAKATIAKHEKTLTVVAEKTEMAYEEYKNLEEQCVRQSIHQMKAEQVAHEYLVQRDNAVRESKMWMKNIPNDERFIQTMVQNQELNDKNAQMKLEYDIKIKELESELKTLKEDLNYETVQSQNADLLVEKDSLIDRLTKKEKESCDLHSKYTSLLDKYKDLELKYEESQRAPPPPPPPPPPPLPPPSVSIFDKIRPKLGKKGAREAAKAKLQAGGALVTDDFSKAMEEMMKRIKSGKALKPVLKSRSKSTQDENGGAMVELQGILKNMKKSRSEDDLSVLGDGLEEESELEKAFKKRNRDKQEKEQAKSSSPENKETQSVTSDKGILRSVQNNRVVSRPTPAPRKLSTIQDDPED